MEKVNGNLDVNANVKEKAERIVRDTFQIKAPLTEAKLKPVDFVGKTQEIDEKIMNTMNTTPEERAKVRDEVARIINEIVNRTTTFKLPDVYEKMIEKERYAYVKSILSSVTFSYIYSDKELKEKHKENAERAREIAADSEKFRDFVIQVKKTKNLFSVVGGRKWN